MIQTQTTSNLTKKPRKQQEDRVLKRMSYADKREQLRMRRQIMEDPQFLAV